MNATNMSQRIRKHLQYLDGRKLVVKTQMKHGTIASVVSVSLSLFPFICLRLCECLMNGGNAKP